MEKIRIICENTGSSIDTEMGTSLLDIVKGLGAGGKYPFLAAYVNNRIKELNYRIYTPVTVRFIDITHFEGYRVYQRTASFIMQAAVREVCPGHRFYIRHSLGDGFYCEIEGEREISQARCDEIAAAARRIVADNLTITRRKVLTTEAREIYERLGFDDKTVLLETRPRLYSEIYTMATSPDISTGRSRHRRDTSRPSTYVPITTVSTSHCPNVRTSRR